MQHPVDRPSTTDGVGPGHAGSVDALFAAAYQELRKLARFRLRGGLPLRMTDFGIQPPVALFGLIRARDELWVSVDLNVELAAH